MVMDEQSRKETDEIKRLPISMLEYLPTIKWRLTLSALTVLIILLLVFLGQMMGSYVRYARLEAEMNRYESLWESQQISNYEYTLRASTDEGYSQVAVRVEDGAAISEGLAHPFTGETYRVPTGIGSFDTVPELFDRIRKALGDKEEDGVNRLVIRYDAALSYPTHIELTGQPEGQLLRIQGNYSYEILDFNILEPEPIRYARLETELDGYENLWKGKEISSYEYTLKAWVDGGYSEASVRVEDGIVISAELANNGTLDINSFDTVPDLFSIIRKALRAKEENGFNGLDIQYDGDFGYPTYIALRDPYKLGDPGTYAYSIVDFKILEHGQTAK